MNHSYDAHLMGLPRDNIYLPSTADGPTARPIDAYLRVACSSGLPFEPAFDRQFVSVIEWADRIGSPVRFHAGVVGSGMAPLAESAQLKGILGAAEAGLSAGLVVADIDRISRSVHVCREVTHRLTASSARLVAVRDGLDSLCTSPDQVAFLLGCLATPGVARREFTAGAHAGAPDRRR